MRKIPICVAMLCLALSARVSAKDEIIQVTAELIEIPSKFPPDDLYDYAYIMKYKVIGGKMDGQVLLVAHYKPLRARREINDEMKKHVGGNLKRFKKGDSHKMSLNPDLQKIWKGAVIDDFFAADRKSVRYWCAKVDPAS